MLNQATYSMTATGFYRNINTSNGQIQRNCGYTVELTGTLSLELKGGGSGGPRAMALRDNWTETSTIAAPCQGITDFTPSILSSPLAKELPRDAANIQFGVTDIQDDGNVIRTYAFVGVLSGTAIEGRFIKSNRSYRLASAISRHEGGYPPTETVLTLRKR